MNTQGSRQGQGQDNNDRNNDRKRIREPAVKSTGGPAPRKMLGQKDRKYVWDKIDKKIKETQTQTYASTSDAQIQAQKETKDSSAQTDFNSRFYIERSDRYARDGWKDSEDSD